MIVIRTPYWKFKTISIAEWKLVEGVNEVVITAKNSQGEYFYPGVFTITKQKALTYPAQSIKGIRMRMIPISDLQRKTI